MKDSASLGKRFLSVLCCIVLTVSLMPFPAYAQESSYDSGNLQAGRVSVGQGLTDDTAADGNSAQPPVLDASAELVAQAVAQSVMTPLFEGSGTAAAPYKISSAEQLRQLAEYLNSSDTIEQQYGYYATYGSASFVLTDDITLADWSVPLGAKSGREFKGTFDGQGHTITFTNASNTSNSNYALFGIVSGGAISNLTVDGAITSTAALCLVAGIVAKATNATITNCANHASVTSSSNTSAGIAAEAIGCTIEGCSNSGAIQAATTRAGGLVGNFYSSSMKNCYNTGSVKAGASNNAGGLVGMYNIAGSVSTSCSIENCFSSGKVLSKGGALIGGFSSGSDAYKDQNSISNCYASDACGKTDLAGSYSSTGLSDITVSNVVFVEDATMRSASFVETMGASFQRTMTYPQLAWEPGDGFPPISGELADATYETGATASALTVSASVPGANKLGWTGTLSYAWYRVNSAGDDVAVGSNSASFTPPTTETGTFQYYCVVTNTWTGARAGTATNTSNTATVSVVDPADPAASLTVALSETSYTFAQDASASTAVLSATVSPVSGTGVGTLTYQWQVADGEGVEFANVDGASGAVESGAVTCPVQLGETGSKQYRLSVTNTYKGVAHVSQSAASTVTVTPVTITSGEQWNTFAAAHAQGDFDGFAALEVEVANDVAGVTVPLGTAAHPFTGTLDGKAHVVGVSISGATHQALVGYAQGADIHDVIVEGTVSGTQHVAGVVAYATGADPDHMTHIYNVGNRAKVTSLSQPADATLYDNWGTGGVAGTLYKNCEIEKCYNTGDIAAPAMVGGVVGYAYNRYVKDDARVYWWPHVVYLHELYNTGTVTAASQFPMAGGILGYYVRGSEDSYAYTPIVNCYNAGKVVVPEGVAERYGAIVGSSALSLPSACTNNYYVEGMLFAGSEQLPDKGSQRTPRDTGNTAVALTALSGSAGVELVNEGAGGTFYKQDTSDQNNGFPLLTWEPIATVPHCAYTFAISPAEADVVLTDSYGRVVAQESSSVQSGTLTVTYSLAKGEYAYTVSPTDPDAYLPESGTVTIGAMSVDTSETKNVTLVGDKHDVTFTVTSNGGAVGDVTVTATHRDTKRSYTATGAGANLKLSLLPGAYDYTVTQPRNNAKAGEFTVQSAALTQTVDLVPCVKVTFAIKDAEGNSVTDATLKVLDSEGNAVSPDADGAYYVPDSVTKDVLDEEGNAAGTETPPFTYQVDKIGYDRVSGGAVVSGGKIEGATEKEYAIELTPLSAWDGSTTQAPSQDAQGVYHITNAPELAWFADYVNGNADEDGISKHDAVLDADIELNRDTLVNQFTPIGDSVYYAGHFNGNGHVVSGLFMAGASYTGLFGATYDATIENLVVAGRVSGTNNVGGIVGYAGGGTVVRNCGNHATVRGVEYVGGIVGAHQKLTTDLLVENCFNKGNVTLITTDSNSGTEGYVGGIVGYAYNARVLNCYNLGTITSNGYGTGGIAGYSWVNTLELEHCYSTGRIVSTFNSLYDYYGTAFGAIVGYYATATSMGVGSGSYWLEGTADRGVGYNSNFNYVNDQSATMTGPSGLAANLDSTGQVFLAPTDSGFNGGYPRLFWEKEDAAIPDLAPSEDGSAGYPWIIDSYEKLIAFQDAVNAGRTYAGDHVKLTVDIDCVADRGSAAVFYGIGYGEGPEGYSSSPFSGIFDGGGHSITNIGAVEAFSGDTVGVFRNLRGATVKNLRVQGTLAYSGDGFAGGLAGYAYGATIENCHVQMNITQSQGDMSQGVGSAAGVVGRSYQSTIVSCLYDGSIDAPYAALVSGIANATSLTTENLAGNYYHNGANTLVKGGFRGVDAAGAAEAVDSVETDELAWLLNSAAGTVMNTSIWGNGFVSDGAKTDGVQFAGEHATAVYRVTNSTTGITVTLTREYAHAGEQVSYENLKPKKGYALEGGAIVTSVREPAATTGDVYVDRTGAAQGSFTMPDADVVLSANTTFDQSTVFNTSVEVVSEDAATRTATVAVSPQTATADTRMTVKVSDIDDESRVLAVYVWEDDADKAEVPTQVVSIGTEYTFVMPRADAKVRVVLGDVRSSGDWWPTDEKENSAKHTRTQEYAYDGNYLGGVLRIDGSAASDLPNYNSYRGNRSTTLVTLDGIEESTIITEGYHYRSTYSVGDGASPSVTANYQGIRVYDFLVMYGMVSNLADATPVTFSNAQGESVTLTIGQLQSHEFNAYDGLGNVIATALPVILAYGKDGEPIPMDAVEKNAGGTVLTYEQTTPLTLVVGQTSTSDDNAKRILKGVSQITVGDEGLNDRHNFTNYTQFQYDQLNVEIIADGKTISTNKLTVAEIEDFADENPAANENHYILGSQWYAGDDRMSSDDITSIDAYEGVSIEALLEYVNAIPEEDVDDAVLEVYGNQGNGRELTISKPLRYFLGGEDESSVGSHGNYDGYDSYYYYGMLETGVRPYLAFGKNGFPLVKYGTESGYEESAYNRFGPLIAVLPANEEYGVSGKGSTQPDAFMAMYVSDLVIRYGSDVQKVDISNAKVTGVAATYTETGSQIRPVPTVTLADGTVLRPGSDYRVVYGPNVKPGVGTVTIQATDGSAYTGSITKTFQIKAAASDTPSDSGTTPSDGGKPGGGGSGNNADSGTSGGGSSGGGSADSGSSDGGTGTGGDGGSAVKPPKTEPATWTRLWGDTALDTMQSISQYGFASADTVVISTVAGYWDALAASSVAGLTAAPVLLTDPSSLSTQAASEIGRLGATRAIIVGGTAAISSDVESQVRSLLGGDATVTRLAGENAQGTARAIAAQLGASKSDTCVIATSNGYWDALSASPYSYATRSPIFLTTAEGDLTSETLEAIRAGGYSRAVITGGTAAVSSGAESALQSVGVGSVVRLGGADAYATSGLVAAWAIGQGMEADGMGIATSGGYWDALAGAALCGSRNSVLLLADDGRTDNAALASAHADDVRAGFVFGGPNAIGAGAQSAFEDATR